MTGTVEELNEIAHRVGWHFNPEAPKEDIDALVDVFGQWLDDMEAGYRRARIVAVMQKKRRARRGRRSKK